tara:strand:- start:27 stop:392 length:366 start_codon:yes stop_codon:yes gene_type:complete
VLHTLRLESLGDFDVIIHGSALTKLLEPTKEQEAAAAAKEKEEQAALPYKWTQTIGDLDISVEIPGNLKARDLNVEVKKKKLLLAIKGQEPIISVCLLQALKPRLLSKGDENIRLMKSITG